MKLNRQLKTPNSGAALVIVLSFVVLLTVLMVAFFSRATSERNIANGSASSRRADILAVSALDVIVGDLKQEIVAGSSPTPYPPALPIYLPTPAANIIPQRSGTPGAGASPIPNLIRISVRDNGPSGTNPMPSPGTPSRASAVSSGAASLNGRSVSLPQWNSHYLIPRLDKGITLDSSPVTSFTAPDWVLVTRNGPTEQAGIGSGPTAINNSVSTNNNFVTGRYAYAIYDEGGLLDATVAGYPSPSSASATYVASVGRKGSTAFADLTALPAATTTTFPPTQVNNIVGWRNLASIRSILNSQPAGTLLTNYTFTAAGADAYVAYVRGRADGFTSVASLSFVGVTDQSFRTRRELINYRRLTDFSQNSLEYLGTFSRDTTTPSWSPDYDASERGGAGFAYRTNAGTSTSINRDLNKVRVGAEFTRLDGTQAVVGDYLIKRRFPLSRLAWITYKGPSANLQIGNDVDPSIVTPPTSDPVILQLVAKGVSLVTIRAGTDSNIKSAFGLVWDSRTYVQPSGTVTGEGLQWVYTSPTSSGTGGSFDPITSPSGPAASAIKTLDTVQGESREPDFFELLQAVILNGSLGQNTGGGTVKTAGGSAEVPPVFPDIHMSNKMQHLLSIGAAIVDQADPDSIPTRIRMDLSSGASWLALGAESLPCITAMCPVGGVSAEDSTKWATYLLFQLWNPNRNVPTQPPLRLRIDGGIGVFNGNGLVWPNGGGVLSTYIGTDSGKNIAIPTTSTFAVTPFPMTTSKVSVSGFTQESFVPVPVPSPSPDPGKKYAGFRLKDFTMPAGTTSQKPELWLQLGASIPFNATLEVDAGGGIWLPYNYFVGINATNTWISNDPLFVRAAQATVGTPVAFLVAPDGTSSSTKLPYCLMKCDPRSTRFGIFQVDTNTSTTLTSHARIDVPLWEKSNSKYKSGWGGAIGSDVEHVPLLFGTKPYLPATLCINTDASSNSVTGYVDPDGVRRFADAGYQPNSGNNNSSTPFDDGQLQYEAVVLNRPFRNVGELGYTFRDLPWKSLDFFTANSADAGLLDVFSVNDDPPLVAGRVNLNTRQAPVVQALVQKALWDEYDTTNLISTTGASGFSHSDTMSQNYADYILQNSNLLNRSGLVTSLSGSTQIVEKVLKPGNGLGHENEGAKTRREAVARSIASCGQTRTWNLMIDVIAQSGRYPPTATSLANFVVEGEKRYWLHIAIDRFTGEIIDQQLEAVYE